MVRTKIETFVFPAGTSEIGGSVFAYCSELKHISLPQGITAVGDDLFYGCSALETVEIPNSVIRIGKNAFFTCSALKELVFPEQLEEIGDYAFEQCSALQNFALPDSLAKIGAGAFQGCSGITEIQLLDLKEMGENCFEDCINLKKLYLAGTITELPKDAFRGCKALKEIVLPKTLTVVGDNAFYDCLEVEKITYPAAVQQVGIDQFRSSNRNVMPKLSEVYFLGDAPASIHKGAFRDVTATVYYPTDNDTWTDEVKQDYGGNLTWVTQESKTVDVTNVVLDREKIYLKIGDQTELTATIQPENATDKSVIWRSSAPSVAMVRNGQITARAPGTAMITAEAGSGIVASCTVTVAPEQATIIPETVTTYPGGTVKVPVYLSGNPGFAGYAFRVSYDTEALSLQSVEKGSLIKEKGSFSTNPETGSVNWSSDSNIEGDGEIFCLVFSVNENSSDGNYPIFLQLRNDEESNFADQNAETLPVLFQSGAITVHTVMYGDLNGDEKVTIADSILIARYLAKYSDLTDMQKMAADVTGDGNVTVADAVKLLQYLADLIDELDPETAHTLALFSTPETRAIVTVGSKVETGDTVTVPVQITGNPGFAGFQFSINYDVEQLELTDITKGSLLSEDGSWTANVAKSTVVWCRTADVQGDGDLFYLTFRWKNKPQKDALSKIEIIFNDGMLTDQKWTTVPVRLEPGYLGTQGTVLTNAQVVNDTMSFVFLPGEEVEEEDVLLYVAFYLDGQLVDSKTIQSRSGTDEIELPQDITYDQIKMFALDQEEHNPLCQALEWLP